tara:strand:- start:21674 stop:22672 length:999 start_codon:yes stop_codon:yes gene_type:complete
MFMKRIILIVLTFSTLSVLGQQDPQFTQNFANKLYNNPGYAGMNGAICATVIGRQQWLGFDGAPRTGLISIHSPIKLPIETSLINLGVGFTAANDIIGPLNTNFFKLAISNRFTFNAGTLSIGVGVGTLGAVIDGSNFLTPDGEDALTGVITDPNLAPGVGGKAYGFDFDMGAYFRSASNNIFAGVSMMHLTQSELQGDLVGDQSNDYKVESHLYVMGGYRINNLVPNWEFVPSVFLKTEFSTTQFDFNARAIYKGMIWGGVSYRIQDAISPMAGYKHDFGAPGVMKIGASYDLNTSKLRSFNSGTVEVFLNYCFTITPKPKITIHKNPRWL